MDYNTEIKKYLDGEIQNRGDNTHRYASFDFCFAYFHKNRENLKENMQLSCLQLWSYLASWGMLCGSSELLQKSVACLKPLIGHIADCDKRIWNIDVDNYTQDNIKLLCEEYKKIEEVLTKILNKDKKEKEVLITDILNNNEKKKEEVRPSVTLITKIMLGVYGNVPAFDTYFTKTFRNLFDNCGFRTVNEQSLKCIYKFWTNNKKSLEEKISVIDFDSKATDLYYTKAKLIDMYGFTEGL